jgi:hypothetical protein
MDYYRRVTEEARVPFIYLSQGATRRSNMRWDWPPKPGLIFPKCFADGPRGETALQLLSNTA